MSKFVAFLNVFVFMLTAIMSGITKEGVGNDTR